MTNYATRAYASVGINTAVESASPHALILMLYDGLLKQLRVGRAHMLNKEIAHKATCISRALNILDQGLSLSLDLKAGGDLGQQLESLYDYCSRRLLHANLKNDVAALDEVIGLIEPLRAAWLAIAPTAPAKAASGAGR
jgi:flagellar secretion chaperone FliS